MKRLIFVFLAVLVLVPSSWAQRIPETRLPDGMEKMEFAPRTLLLPHSFIVSSQAALFVPEVDMTSGSRRRASASPSPTVEWEAMVDYDAGIGAISRIFTQLPIGSRVEHEVIDSNGVVRFYHSEYVNLVMGEGDVFLSPTMGFGPPWNGPLPADLPDGVTIFRTIATIYGKKYIAFQEVAKGTGVAQGPLDEAIADSSGGILLKGLFLTKPVVASFARAGMIELQGMDYIPPGAAGPLPATITGCSGVAGDSTNLWCKTVASQ